MPRSLPAAEGPRTGSGSLPSRHAGFTVSFPAYLVGCPPVLAGRLPYWLSRDVLGRCLAARLARGLRGLGRAAAILAVASAIARPPGPRHLGLLTGWRLGCLPTSPSGGGALALAARLPASFRPGRAS